jgi:hypothetical protein
MRDNIISNFLKDHNINVLPVQTLYFRSALWPMSHNYRFDIVLDYKPKKHNKTIILDVYVSKKNTKEVSVIELLCNIIEDADNHGTWQNFEEYYREDGKEHLIMLELPETKENIARARKYYNHWHRVHLKIVKLLGEELTAKLYELYRNGE